MAELFKILHTLYMKRALSPRAITAFFLIIAFAVNSLTPLPAHAQFVSQLPVPGKMVNLSQTFEPALIKGLTVDANDPFRFNFIMAPGQSNLSGQALQREGDRLVKYFFA